MKPWLILFLLVAIPLQAQMRIFGGRNQKKSVNIGGTGIQQPIMKQKVTTNTITITWDYSLSGTNVANYYIYEYKGQGIRFKDYTESTNITGTNIDVAGRNWVRVGSVSGDTNVIRLTITTGLHVYTATAADSAGLESEFSNYVFYRQR